MMPAFTTPDGAAPGAKDTINTTELERAVDQIIRDKLSVNAAGYCNAGPLRPPFRVVPEEIFEHAKQTAAKWRQLCDKYPHGKAAAA